MKVLVVLAAVVVATIAEPPVDNRYLPPQQGFNRGNFGAPSQTYGPPGGNSGFGPQRQTDAFFRGSRPSSTYGTPSFGRNGNGNGNRPSPQYLPPQSQPNSQYLPPTSQYSQPQSQPRNQYLPPQSQPNNQYLAPTSQYTQQQSQPRNQYLPPQSQPNNQYLPPTFGSNSQFGSRGSFGSEPSSQYGAPGFGGSGFGGRTPSSQYGAPSAPSQQYGAPAFGNGGSNGYEGAQSRAYLPPGAGGRGGYAGDDGSNSEPANYSFEYMVKDDESGNDFGHRESRQGDRAEGLYYVVLPDGRKQTVEYEADENGYKPRISYEDLGAQGGYARGGQQNGGPY